MAQRYELEDGEWEQIRPLLPRAYREGRPPKCCRQLLNGMFWILRSGAPWRDMPERYGPWQTVYHRFNCWRRTGVIDRILEKLQLKLDEEGYIDWDLWCVDGSSVRAHKSAAGANKKGGLQRSRKTTHWAIREAGGGQNSTWLLTAKAFR